ncbi:MAG: hypothetical protein QOF21_2961, partial [Actinomycetota bacterium]
ALILGIQGIGLAVIARAYAGHLGLLPNSARLERGLERLTLDRGLVVGALLILLGAAAFIVAVINWGTTDFGQLDVVRTIRLPIIGMVFVVAGMQLMLVSFTLGLGELGEPPS